MKRNSLGIHQGITLAMTGCLLCMAAISCKVGPDYRRPAVAVPTTFKSATTQEAPPPRLASNWWRLFDDPVLDQLEETAIKANPSLQAAMARVMESRAAARAIRSQFYPNIVSAPTFTESRASSNRTSSRLGSGGTNADIQIPFDLTYEIDIWGRVRRSYEASESTYRASAIDYVVVLQTLQADVAQDYFSLRYLDAQDKILRESVESYRVQVGLTQKQLATGIVGRIDLVQAQTLLETAVAQEIDIRRQRADVEHALAILLGRPPGELSLDVRPQDQLPPAIPAGLPVSLLSRRPDVAEAEQNLVTANASLGATIATLYPRLSLTGSAGYESMDLRHLLDWESRFWSLGPNLTIPLFNAGQLEANVEQARARYLELVATYRSQVLVAFREVEDALTDLHLRADAAAAQERAVQAAREYLSLARTQYQRGLTNYLIVVDAERTLLNAELAAAQILNNRLVSTVLLIKALGGGWDGVPAQAPPTPTTQP